MNYRQLGAALLAALALTAAAVPAGAATEEEQARQDLERARQEVEKARTELQKATRDLARSMAKVERDNPKVQYFEYMTDPKRAVLGVLIPDDVENGETRGVRLLAVTPGSGAEKAGLKAGDLLTSLNGKPMAADGKKMPPRRMKEIMRTLKAGDEVKVEYERDGRNRSTTVVTQAPEPEFTMTLPPIPTIENLEHMEWGKGMPWFRGPAVRGLELCKLDEDLGGYFKTTEGVLVIKAPEGGLLGLKGGDVIQKIDGVTVSEPVTVLDKLRSRGEEQTVKLEVLRKGRTVELQGQIPVAEAGMLVPPTPMAPRAPRAPKAPKPATAPTPAPDQNDDI
jgi:type II secretory pathway component PulC